MTPIEYLTFLCSYYLLFVWEATGYTLFASYSKPGCMEFLDKPYLFFHCFLSYHVHGVGSGRIYPLAVLFLSSLGLAEDMSSPQGLSVVELVSLRSV